VFEKREGWTGKIIQLLKLPRVPGEVVHTCNLSYLGDRDREDLSLWPARQKVHEIPSQSQKIGCGSLAYSCHSSYLGSVNRRVPVQIGLGINGTPY
jgi:hypothetical protein